MKQFHLAGKLACALIATVAVISGCQKKETSPAVPEATPTTPASPTTTTPPATTPPTTDQQANPNAPAQTTPPATTDQSTQPQTPPTNR
jgi:hypothetical protein